MMLWKYVKDLSPVSQLWELWWRYFVKKERSWEWVEFYNTSDFKNRVDTFLDQNSEKLRYVFEEWEELQAKDQKSIKKLAIILSELYNDIICKMPFKEYIEQEYQRRIKNLPKSIWEFPISQQKIINDYFIRFKNNVWQDSINLSRIHWDLKPDNVIINKDKLTIIDWERCKKGCYIQDLQRFVSCLDDDEKDIFINEIEKNLKYKEPNEKILYLFHEFLVLILWLSKEKIDFDTFVSTLKKGWIDDI